MLEVRDDDPGLSAEPMPAPLTPAGGEATQLLPPSRNPWPLDEPQLEVARIRDYQIIDRLGGGGMGVVYRARHAWLHKQVALKLLSPQLTADQEAVARFHREMEAVGKLDHANIVRAMDAGEEGGRHYLVMEFVDGLTLSQLSQRLGKLDIADACEMIRQAAVGLEHIHRAQLVHRDIKPSNLMLTRDGCVKVLDLGLARLHQQDERAALTETGQVMGTWDYMAPEQLEDVAAVDVRADIYSLGCSLYKLLCGEAPFGGSKYDTPARKMKALIQESVPPIHYRRSGLPSDLVDVLEQMTAKDRQNRFQTPAQVAQALQPFCRGCDLLGLIARASDPHCRVPAGDNPVAANPADVSTSARSCRDTETYRPVVSPAAPNAPSPSKDQKFSSRRRWLAVGALVGLAIVSVLLGMRLFPPSPEVIPDHPAWLPPPRHDFPLHVDFKGGTTDAAGRIVFAPGSLAEIEVKAQRDTHAAIWWVDSEGTVTQLFPNAAEQDDRLTADKLRRVPGEQQDYSIRATPSQGVDYLIVTAATKPWWISFGERSVGPFRRGTHAAYKTTRGLGFGPGPSQQVSEVYIPFRVRSQ